MTAVKGRRLSYLLEELKEHGTPKMHGRGRTTVRARRAISVSKGPLSGHPEPGDAPDKKELNLLKRHCYEMAVYVYLIIERDKSAKQPWNKQMLERSNNLFMEFVSILGLKQHELISYCENACSHPLYECFRLESLRSDQAFLSETAPLFQKG